jgi:hypothetical protein
MTAPDRHLQAVSTRDADALDAWLDALAVSGPDAPHTSAPGVSPAGSSATVVRPRGGPYPKLLSYINPT